MQHAGPHLKDVVHAHVGVWVHTVAVLVKGKHGWVDGAEAEVPSTAQLGHVLVK